MRVHVLAMAGVVCLSATPSLALPLGSDSVAALATSPLMEMVHHKRGHKGGPPWARQQMNRQDWVGSRPAYRRSCATRYEEEYDPWSGYVRRRPVEICR